MKMMAVGLGNREGAADFHSWSGRLSHEELIESKAIPVLESGKVFFGIAILENAYHETAHLELIPADSIRQTEKALFQQARELMPSLPVENLDILLIDEIGKDISGTGLDPNITGRWFKINSVWQDKPRIVRILVRDLTRRTHGNALGIGLADFCAQRVLDQMDRGVTIRNALTSRNTVVAKLPPAFETDRQLLEAAVESLALLSEPLRVRVIRIRNTLDLGEILVSENLVEELSRNSQISHIGEPEEMRFDDLGNLSLF
jgi:hypothetical protein